MKRFWALDRLRALSVLLMVQGHTFTALMRPAAFSPEVARWHGLLHGLTAPAFLLGAGLAFGFATYGSYEQHRQLGRPLWKRLLRYSSLFAIGYALQLPGASLWAAFRVQGEQYELVCRVGPLQLLALILGLSQLAILVIARSRVHAAISALLGLAILLIAERVGRAELSSRLPLLIGAYFDDARGSQFPIFPYASFTLFGIAVAGLLRERANLAARAPLVVVGGALAGLGYLAFTTGFAPFHPHWFWRTSWAYFGVRLGFVLLMLGLLVRTGDRTLREVEARSRARELSHDGLSALLARRSLTAYVAHLLLLYGTPFTPNLVYHFGATLSLSRVSALFVLIFGLTVLIAWLWDQVETEPERAPRYARAGVVLVGLTLLAR